MMNKMRSRMNASILRIILFTAMLLLLVAGIGGFVFAIGQLKSYAVATSALDAEANAGAANVRTLLALRVKLLLLQPAVDKAHKIVAESQSYQYQNEVIADLSKYAKDSGVFITAYDFNAEASSGAASPSTPSSGGDLSAVTIPGLPAGVKATTVNISLRSPESYSNVMKFIQQIEQNVTKMQIGNIALTKSDVEGSSQDSVDLPSLQIQVYIR